MIVGVGVKAHICGRDDLTNLKQKTKRPSIRQLAVRMEVAKHIKHVINIINHSLIHSQTLSLLGLSHSPTHPGIASHGWVDGDNFAKYLIILLFFVRLVYTRDG